MTAGKNAQHMSVSWEWGSPPPVTNVVHQTFASVGGLEVDVCSSAYWNHWTMRARRFYDERSDARVMIPRDRARSVACNAPGEKTRTLVRELWELLVVAWKEGRYDSIVWIGFSLEQLVMLQSSPAHPLQFPTLVPCNRVRWLRRGEHNGPPVTGDQPTHGNFLTLLPSRCSQTLATQQMTAFRAASQQLDDRPWGAIVRPM